jgi:hypothetical protein
MLLRISEFEGNGNFSKDTSLGGKVPAGPVSKLSSP